MVRRIENQMENQMGKSKEKKLKILVFNTQSKMYSVYARIEPLNNVHTLVSYMFRMFYVILCKILFAQKLLLHID